MKPTRELTAKDYQRMTVKEVAELHGIDEAMAKSLRDDLIIEPWPTRIVPGPKPKVATLVTRRSLSPEGLRERIAREVQELITSEGGEPDRGWHLSMARIHEEHAR